MKLTSKGRDTVIAALFFTGVFAAMWLASALAYWATGVK